MAVEDKLEYFYTSTMSALKKKNDMELAELREHLICDMDEYKKNIQADSLIEERLHKDEARREQMKAISLEKLAVRRVKSEKEAEIKNRLFEEVAQVLEEYRKTPEYTDTLCEMILSAKAFAGNDDIDIFICKTDEALAETLRKRTGLQLNISDIPFSGGMQAAIPKRNIFINNSFSSLIEEEKEAYIVRP